MSVKSLNLKSKGLITRKDVRASVSSNSLSAGNGINFILPSGVEVLADYRNISNTQRNTVLENGGHCLCLTEHFLAACSLLDIRQINIELSEDELPFGDGSAKLWVDFFKEKQLAQAPTPKYDLHNEIIVKDASDPNKYIKATPADKFKLSYQLDWKHPKIGKQEFNWSLGEDINELALARTFSAEDENKMLGLSGWIVGLTEDDFSMPLLFPDEPARHKALDLIGDLYLSGINPLSIKMHITSSKGGHHLNSLMAKEIAEQLSK